MTTDQQHSKKAPETGQSETVSGKKRSYETQDKTSLYESYLFGAGTYAEGSKRVSLADTTEGRLKIRLISRGIFGAAAFALGGHYCNLQLKGYTPENFSFTLQSLKSKPLQAIAKAIDATVGKAIHSGVRFFAKGTEQQREVIANRAVRFRQKSYYHETPGHDAGRSYGAEIVNVTFDFACASVGDASARSIIQLFDPALEKPWMNHGKVDLDKGAKAFGQAAWRIFSKNQGEDWAAAFPYVFQMKLQRNMIAKWAPGFKLTSDTQTNSANAIIGKAGNIIGDYQKWGALDLQLRFMGYNWYTLMYREAYDAVAHKFHQWRNNGYTLSMPEHFNPVSATAETVAQGTRYVVKSLIKSALYMAPSVPFFWVFRVPQSKWRAPLIYDQNSLGENDNAYITRPGHDKIIQPEYNPRYGATEYKESTFSLGARVWQGGVHTNGDGGIITQAHYGRPHERSVARPITPMGGDEAYKWKNQKTLSAKLLNPFGWASYKTGSIAVKVADKIAEFAPQMDKPTFKDAAARERLTRSFVDASWSYTPYFMAKTEFGLRVDDRGVNGDGKSGDGKDVLGEMDKTIYQGMDALATFDMKGVYQACQRAGNLLFNSERGVGDGTRTIKRDTTGAGKNVPQSTITASTAEIPTLTTPTEKILTHPDMKKSVEGVHTQRLQERAAVQERFIYPESRTLQ